MQNLVRMVRAKPIEKPQKVDKNRQNATAKKRAKTYLARDTKGNTKKREEFHDPMEGSYPWNECTEKGKRNGKRRFLGVRSEENDTKGHS